MLNLTLLIRLHLMMPLALHSEPKINQRRVHTAMHRTIKRLIELERQILVQPLHTSTQSVRQHTRTLELNLVVLNSL